MFAGPSALPVAPVRDSAPVAGAVLLEPNGTLDVVGPTGTGFSLIANWSVTSTPAGVQTFTATGAAVLKTAVGQFPFTISPSSPLTSWRTGPFRGFGSLLGGTLAGLALDTSSHRARSTRSRRRSGSTSTPPQ